jgi:hypothetical protein
LLGIRPGAPDATVIGLIKAIVLGQKAPRSAEVAGLKAADAVIDFLATASAL